MNRDTLFRVPIYRESPQEYHEELERKLQEISSSSGFSTEEMEGQYMGSFSFQKPWKYNRVIGWIELFTSWTQIRVDLWFTSAQRVRKRWGKIVYKSSYEGYEIADSNFDSNEEIRQGIRIFLRETHREYWPNLERYYLDVSAIDSILDFVDFRSLIEIRVRKRKEAF